MDAWMIDAMAFAGAFLAVMAVNAALVERALAERRRLNEEVQKQLRQQRRERIRSRNLAELAERAENPARTWGLRLTTFVEQSGLNISIQRVVLMSLRLGALAALIAGAMTGSALLAGCAACAGAAAPPLYVVRARKLRLEKLLAQLPDAFELMSRVLRAGQTISQAMQIVAEQGSPPISLEFYDCHEKMKLGMTPETALRDLAQRTGLLEIKIFTVAVLVQRQTGGNLSELFDKMANVVRERFRIRGMINSLTAQGRLQAIILSSLPFVMFLLLVALHPDYELKLLSYPLMIFAALGLMACGAIWIHRVVHFDF